MVSRRLSQSCPVALSTYATLHLDTMSKILNHVVLVTVICDVFLFLSSFSVAYLDHHLGFNTVLCSFLLGACSVVVLLIVNNSRISALSILAPTEFMVGMAMGLCIGAAVLAAVLSSTYQTATVCDKPGRSSGRNSHTNNSHININPSTQPYDSVLADTCANHASSMNTIWFWAGLVAWLNVVIALLLASGRHELSLHYRGRYESIVGQSRGSSIDAASSHQQSTPSAFDFEESFRRQQQEILGAQQAAAVRDRAAAMFVGDYATIPEVTHGSVSGGGGGSSSNHNLSREEAGYGSSRPQNGESLRILSV
jgi:hypothetical protein